ncbi:hypothetical protein NM688_g2757 [Phlebia brevispora]|uniref:Uncharacterized protein n=1 Tax=Phlebia brevispora TaxID=194682 RepID=A0ACC1T7L2_9APHY|nr:hypothetical protein NM688_g2757 [Phlebia brevispora]
MVFDAVLLLGKTECGAATPEEEMRLRMLTPAVKAFAADKACAAMEECMAALGGQGYMEENGFGVNIRDCLVEKIWEGTVVVLALDTVRAASKPGVLQAWSTWAKGIMASCPFALQRQVESSLLDLQAAIQAVENAYQAPMPPLLPRPALILFSYVTSALCLLEHASWAHRTGEPTAETDTDVLKRWIEESGFRSAVDDVARVARTPLSPRAEQDAAIVYGSSPVAHSAPTTYARL